MFRIVVILASTILALAAVSAADPVPDPVEIELAGLVTDVAKVLEKQDQKEIRIGKFTGDGDVPSHFGPEIQRILRGEFTKRKIDVNKDALIEIKGDYRPARENPSVPALKEMFLRINATLVNTKTGTALAGIPIYSRAAYGNDALAKAIAVPLSLPASADRSTRNEEIKKRIDKPETYTTQTKVQSSASSPFAVELLVVSDPKAPDPSEGRPVTVKEGLAFVDVKKTEFYRVKIHNNAPFDVGVRLSIDGLDQYVFSDPEFCEKGRPKFTHIIIGKGKTYAINGWFRNKEKADSFVVTEYAKSAVAELNASQGDIGQICIQFFAAWDTEEQLGQNEGRGSRDATGRGTPVDTDLVLVPKFIGALRDQVAIRYTKK